MLHLHSSSLFCRALTLTLAQMALVAGHILLILCSTSGSAQSPSREYIRIGGRLVAIAPPGVIISNIQASPGTASATVTWTTDAPSDSQVEYGLSTSYGQSSLLNTAMTTNHSVTVSSPPLSSGTSYHYRVKSKNATGILTTSSDQTFTTLQSAPSFLVVEAIGVSATTATIHWTTDLPSTSQVNYGPTAAYGQTTTLVSTPTTDHVVDVSGLTPGSVYHYRVRSQNSIGESLSTDRTFTTGTGIPVISAVATPANGLAARSVHVVWTTDIGADSQVEYGPTAGYGQSTVLDVNMVTSHDVSISALAAATGYHYRVKSRSATGSLATSADYAFTTLEEAPVITNIAVVPTVNSATITWNTDNINSDSEVEYGTTTAYGSVASSAVFTKLHSVTLPATLSPGVSYNYRVKSKTAGGLSSTSANFTFTTQACSINPTAASVVYGGGSGTIAVTCVGPWTTSTTGFSWGSITPTSGSGNGTVTYTAVKNPDGNPARVASLLIAGQTFTVTQEAAPHTLLLQPASATSVQANQQVQFNAILDGFPANGGVTWSVSSGVGSVAGGLYTAPGVILASQTSASVTATYAPANLSVTASIGLIAYAPPSGLSMTPSSGTALTQIFSFAVTDPNGASAVGSVDIVFNPTEDPVNGCFIRFQSGSGAPYIDTLQLAVNTGNGYVGPFNVGSASVLENSQCRVNLAGASVTRVSNSFVLNNLSITFKPGFSGLKNVFMSARNSTGAQTAFSTIGTWNLSGNPAALPPNITLDNPATGATVTGNAVTISGWAMDNATRPENSISRVEVWVDGQYVNNATYGTSRADICATYAGRPGCPNVGFTYSWNTTALSNGPHSLRVVAFDGDNPPQSAEILRTITVNNSGNPPVAVTPTQAYSAAGWTPFSPETVQFTAKLFGVPSTAVTWSVTPLTSTQSISSTGLYTPPNDGFFTAGDRMTVKAVSQADANLWDAGTVILVGFTSPPILGASAGQTFRFITGLGNVTWEVVQGPGTISSTGYYTAPTSGYTPGQYVKILAKKISDPTVRQQGWVLLQ